MTPATKEGKEKINWTEDLIDLIDVILKFVPNKNEAQVKKSQDCA